MKEESNATEQLEYAISALKDAEVRNTEAFEEWIKDESNEKLFNELLDYKEALMNLQGVGYPDEDES